MTAGTEHQEQATTTVNGVRAGEAAPLQDARAGAKAERNSRSANGVTPPWSHRAGRSLRGGASATFRHPAGWGIWDRHPASVRAVIRRSDGSPVHRAVWVLLAIWTALFSLLAIAPRNKTCWLIAATILVAWLTL